MIEIGVKSVNDFDRLIVAMEAVRDAICDMKKEHELAAESLFILTPRFTR